MKIIIELKKMTEEEAQDILDEIEDKMLPDYEDSIKSMGVKD